MFERSSITIHARGLIVLAVAATTLELLALPRAHAHDRYTSGFEAIYAPAIRSGDVRPQSHVGLPPCDAADDDQSCGTATGGPSGGFSDRN